MFATKIGFKLNPSRRTTNKQTHRVNYPTENINKFYRKLLFIINLVSLIMSIKDIFSDEHLKKHFLYLIYINKR